MLDATCISTVFLLQLVYARDVFFKKKKNCLLLGTKLVCVPEANRQWTTCCGFVVPDAENERYLIFPENLTSCIGSCLDLTYKGMA